MSGNEIDRDAIRGAGQEFSALGLEMHKAARRLDEEPFYLRASDWGQAGGSGASMKQKYDKIRDGMQDFLDDGGGAFNDLMDVLYRAALRTRVDEEIGVEMFDKIGRGLEETEAHASGRPRTFGPHAE